MYCLFFSFKGGVGRTSALMNTARFLSKKKKRVLVIDLDLAAPGVDIFEMVNVPGSPSYNPTTLYCWNQNPAIEAEPFNAAEEKRPSRQAEMLKEARRRHASGAPRGFVEFALKFTKEVNNERAWPILAYPEDVRTDSRWGTERYLFQLPKKHLGDGDIIVMRAGNYDFQEDYQRNLGELNLANLDEGISGGLSRMVVSADQPKPIEPKFIRHLKGQIESVVSPDYVLVDARPGFESASVLGISWLADAAVLCFNLNPWNLEGIFQAYDQVYPVLAGSKEAITSNLLLLASPIPPNATESILYKGQFDFISHRMNKARNAGGSQEWGGPIQILHSNALLLRDLLISDHQPNDPICLEYDRLANLIIQMNPNDIVNRLRRIEALDAPYSDKAARYTDLLQHTQNDPAVSFEFGRHLLVRQGDADQAHKLLKEAWEAIGSSAEEQYFATDGVKPQSPYLRETAYWLSRAELRLTEREIQFIEEAGGSPASSSKVIKSLKDLREAFSRCIAFASNTDPSTADVFALQGELKHLEARLQRICGDSAQRMACLKHACECYQEAVNLDTRQPRYHYALARASFDLAAAEGRSPTPGDTAEGGIDPFASASSEFERAYELRQDMPSELRNWGRLMLSRSMMSDGVLMPGFIDHYPFIEHGTGNKLWPGDVDTRPAPSVEHLVKATDTIEQSLRGEVNPFGHFLVGLLMAIRGRIEDNQKRRSDYLRRAISSFNHATVLDPTYSPAYFYQCVVRLLLHPDPTNTSTTDLTSNQMFRQAFYRLEQFIELEKYRLARERKWEIKEKLKAPFYFDTADIVLIRDNLYGFLGSLEHALGFPRIADQFFFFDVDNSVNAKILNIIRDRLLATPEVCE
jgi:hypothetical protein